MKKDPDCLCDECTLQEYKFVPWYLPAIKQLPILFVGQAPGEVETITKKPFTGPAGKRHWSLCKASGINKDLIPHTNVCSCWPPEDRRPDLLESRCCNGRLKREVLQVKPRLIIALGDCAMEALTGKKGIMKERGRFLPLLDHYDYSCKVLCTVHPSFVMKQPQWTEPSISILKLIHDFLEGKTQDESQPNFTYDPDADTLHDYLETKGIIDVDTETTGLDTLQDEIIGHSFSATDDSAMAVIYTTPKENDQRFQVVKSFLQDPTKGKSWQNGSFDTEIARTHNIQDDGFIYDTRLAQQLIQSDLPSDLDFLRSQYTSIKPYKPPKSEMKNLLKWGRDKLLEYACWDAYTTRQVRLKQLEHLSEKELRLMNTLLIPLVRAIGRIERRGFRVNEESMAKLMAYFHPKIEALEREFWALGVNPRSPVQLAPFFGVKSTKEDVLEGQIKRGHSKSDLMRKLLDFRSYDVMLSKYVVGIHRRMRNNRIHTHLKIEGTGTGRLSSEDPNLQNVPEVMRVIYEPDPGYTLLAGDYSQIELWVGAILAGGGQMLKDLQDGLDVHYITAQLCFPHIPLLHGTRKKDFTHMQDLAAKTVTFGTFYGRSPHSIAREFAVTVSEAERWQLRILNKYPELAAYKRHIEQEYSRKGYLETPFGRRRYVQSITQGYNFPVQSSASDVTLTSIVLADHLGLELLISVHDSIVFQVPEKDWISQAKRMQNIMERKVPELDNISFKVTYAKGPNWYEMNDVTEEIKNEIKHGGPGKGDPT